MQQNPYTPAVQVAEFVEKLAKLSWYLRKADRDFAFANAEQTRAKRDAWDREHAA